MLTTLMTTLMGGGMGALMRLIPEVLKLFSQKKDMDHEYRMTHLQLEIDQARATQDIDKLYANQSLEAVKGEMAAYTVALKSQGTITGVKWIDGLNQSVRPVLTYWWQALFTLYKVCSIIVAWRTLETFNDFTTAIWTADDAGILSMILGFWFVDRAMKYMKR